MSKCEICIWSKERRLLICICTQTLRLYLSLFFNCFTLIQLLPKSRNCTSELLSLIQISIWNWIRKCTWRYCTSWSKFALILNWISVRICICIILINQWWSNLLPPLIRYLLLSLILHWWWLLCLWRRLLKILSLRICWRIKCLTCLLLCILVWRIA